MPNYRLDISYDGTGFRGYAKQPGQRTVQGEVESALERILGLVPDTSVAGRTDSGVHAREQVLSFEAEELDTVKVVKSLNTMLAGEIVTRSMRSVPDDFNARFSAVKRVYRYRASRSYLPDPLLRHQIWYLPAVVDTDRMNTAAALFVGEIDFTSFCKSVEGRSNTRRVIRSEWEESGDFLDYWVEANAFCHQMVRSLVGLCFDVGRGHASLQQVDEIIERKKRSTMGTVAPPHGLILWEVGYEG